MLHASRQSSQQQKQTQYRTQKAYPSYQTFDPTDDPSLPTQKRQNYDQQFTCIYQQIVNHEYFSRITKHEKIRINKWLTKLSNISTNDLWKKNRNNYIKLIRLMFDCELIIAPFLMMPPQRDLHKLTPHQINVIIDQVDKLIDERDNRGSQHINNNNKQLNTTNNREKVHKVQWTQQSAYIDHHHNSSIEKSKDMLGLLQNDCNKRTYQSSAITAATGHYSKLTQNQFSSTANYNIPPKHPSTTKHTTSKQKSQSLSKQNYFTKKGSSTTTTTRNNEIQQDSRRYFIKKQKIQTFETQYLGQQEEYMTIMMKNSTLQERNSPILQKDTFELLETHSREAINILKCGFRMLQKIPLQSIEHSSINNEIQTFRRILSENDLLRCEFEKENMFLEEVHNRCHNNLLNTDDKQVLKQTTNNNYALKNITQKTTKLNEKKKKLTLTSQSTRS